MRGAIALEGGGLTGSAIVAAQQTIRSPFAAVSKQCDLGVAEQFNLADNPIPAAECAAPT
jgi:hypothetical protein